MWTLDSFKHPCSWHDIYSKKLENSEILRTLGSLNKRFQTFRRSGIVYAKTLLTGDYVHDPIVYGSNNTLIPLLLYLNHLYIILQGVWKNDTKFCFVSEVLHAYSEKINKFKVSYLIVLNCNHQESCGVSLHQEFHRPTKITSSVAAHQNYNHYWQCFNKLTHFRIFSKTHWLYDDYISKLLSKRTSKNFLLKKLKFCNT